MIEPAEQPSGGGGRPFPEPPYERLQFFAQRHRPARMRAAHWHSQVELNYLADGEMTYLFNGRVLRLPARRVGLFWGAAPHQLIDLRGHGEIIVVYVPLGEFLSLRLPEDCRRRLMGGGFLAERAEDPSDDVQFRRWHGDLVAGGEEVRDLVRSEVACRLRRFALRGYDLVGGIDLAATPGRAPAGASFERVRDMAVFIAEHSAEPLAVEDVAGAAGLHPNYAMTLFRRVLGMTISDYLTRHRIGRAQSLLLDTEMPVAAIASACGFGSTSRFYDVFRQWNAKSPGRYRTELWRRRAAGPGEMH